MAPAHITGRPASRLRTLRARLGRAEPRNYRSLWLPYPTRGRPTLIPYHPLLGGWQLLRRPHRQVRPQR